MHFLDEVYALLMQVFHCHFGGNGAQGIDEFTFDQFLQVLRGHGTPAQGLGCICNRFRGGLNTDIEFGLNINAHAIMGDQRLIGMAPDFKPKSVHVHRNNFVKHRQDNGAAIHDDFLAAKTGTYERYFFGGPLIKPCEDQHHGAKRDQYQ